ncbi:CMP-N-acetylneuraminate-poly-alpha-2,8-sialyltransferase-like [Diadema antillarum]|uniref:CMP-N-acetylneuraminate-poly-alpha-2, 8-sialyltransferase-like n=1 Tax=Diadema antillarum TaxID=105358 RepID=UPI003A8816F7
MSVFLPLLAFLFACGKQGSQFAVEASLVTRTNTPASKVTSPLKTSYIREKVLTKLTLSDIIQIYKTDIDPEFFDFEVNQTELTLQNKTETIPEQDRCAVVGNSGILADSRCGAAIDGHDYVFRMNLAPFGGDLGTDVGYKANATTMNYSQMTRLGRAARKTLSISNTTLGTWVERVKMYNHSVIWYPKGGSRKGNMNNLGRAMGKQFNFEARWAYSPMSLFGAIPRIWKKRTPSTGLLIVSAAAMFCREITMFGFYPFYVDSRNRTLSYHYYDNFKVNYTTNPHKMPWEFKLFEDLEKLGALRLQQDVCDPSSFH